MSLVMLHLHVCPKAGPGAQALHLVVPVLKGSRTGWPSILMLQQLVV
jgi:hypothetical protein